MALLFDADSEVVNHGSDASLDDVVPITVAAWVYPTTIDTGYREIAYKKADANNLWGLLVTDRWNSSVLNNITFTRKYATTSASATSQANTMTVNAWQFVAATFDGTNAPKLYRGTLSTSIAEVAYNDQDAPDGANCDESGADLEIGDSTADAGENFLGSIAFVGIWNRELSLGELKVQQFHPNPTADCKLLTYPGLHGATTVPDLSGNGNNGTITNATVADHVPLGPPFGWDIPPAEKTLGFINIGDVWKSIRSIQVNIGDVWKDLSELQINIGDAWKDV